MFTPTKEYILRNSPHIRGRLTAKMCMWHVIIALLPATLCAFYYFGLPAIAVTATSIGCCLASEWLIARYLLSRVSRASLVAAALTGLLLALNLPSTLPLWTVAIGSAVAIGIGKMCYGGLGCNIFNPALVGRVFLLISFPALMTYWAIPGSAFEADATTGATLLSALKQGHLPDESYAYCDLFLGNRGGSLGETGALALLAGLAYLLWKRIITWHIPVAIIATVIVFDLLLGVQAGIDVLSGGLLLGAVFMATDYVTSPVDKTGMLIYGAMIGIITVCIRRWGAYPEGMSFAILIMNGFTPLINRYCKPRRFGYRKAGKEVAA